MLLRNSGVLVLGLLCVVSSLPVAAERLSRGSFTSCSCECVDGMPQTLCASVQAAQQQTWVCPPSYTCPLPSFDEPGDDFQHDDFQPDDTAATSALTPPHPQAENCRAVRVWHRRLQAYTTVNICDVQTPRT